MDIYNTEASDHLNWTFFTKTLDLIIMQVLL